MANSPDNSVPDRTVVAKFGGTSLATAERFRQVADIVRADPARRAVVVSAPGSRFSGDVKITDLLIGICDAAPNSDERAELQQTVESRVAEIVERPARQVPGEGRLEERELRTRKELVEPGGAALRRIEVRRVLRSSELGIPALGQ